MLREQPYTLDQLSERLDLEVDEIISSICKVAIRFSNIAHDLLPGQIQAETLQLIQNRIEHNIYCTK